MSGSRVVQAAGRVVLEATRASVQFVKLNSLCTARRLTIGMTRSRPVRPRTGGGSKRLDMLGHLQNVLDDIQANQDADELNSDQGQHNGAAPAHVR